MVLPPSDCSHPSLVSFSLWQIHTLLRTSQKIAIIIQILFKLLANPPTTELVPVPKLATLHLVIRQLLNQIFDIEIPSKNKWKKATTTTTTTRIDWLWGRDTITIMNPMGGTTYKQTNCRRNTRTTTLDGRPKRKEFHKMRQFSFFFFSPSFPHRSVPGRSAANKLEHQSRFQSSREIFH